MKKLSYLLIIIILTSCQTATIKNKTFKVTAATVELGSIGQAKSLYNTYNDFTIKSFPLLNNKIRVDIQIHPFNSDINDLYMNKAKYSSLQEKVMYTDSLAVKPEFITVSMIDITGYVNELNADYNKETSTYLMDTKKSVVVTGLAINIPTIDLEKIKLADSYYLINNSDKKYTIALYKQGRRTDILDLKAGTVLAYTLGKFCWALSERGRWYVGDITLDNESCKGKMRSSIKDKEDVNLFKM